MNSSFLFAAALGVVASFTVASCEEATGDEIIDHGPHRLLFAGDATAGVLSQVSSDAANKLKVLMENRFTSDVLSFRRFGEEGKKQDSECPIDSAANAARAYTFLGGEASYFGILGNDQVLDDFVKTVNSCGIPMKAVGSGEESTKVYALEGDGSESRAQFILGTSGLFGTHVLKGDEMEKHDYLVVNAYMLRNLFQRTALHAMIVEAQRQGREIITFVGNPSCINNSQKRLTPIIGISAYLCGTADQFERIYGIPSTHELFELFEKATSGSRPWHKAILISMGDDGAVVIFGGKRYYISEVSQDFVPGSGDHDVYLGALLYGLINGYTVRQASEMARAVVTDLLSNRDAPFTPELKAKIQQIKQSS
ncbi:adenosine kinase [Babesia caballi]|uniref:Adenosine kinase n=1 Tax=Babesia caballi TaxID=5871 RepID=A0AAV4M3B4_BABCB|nr:adenosine kinase [Babesia caballi]